jgi:hypothetical protein
MTLATYTTVAKPASGFNLPENATVPPGAASV